MRIYGRNVVTSALENNEEISKIYLQNGFHDNYILSLIEKKNVSVNYLPKEKMNRMTDSIHQGIIAEVKDYEYACLDDVIKENGFLVILDHLEDPHNFGAIIRTCEAAKVDGIIIPKNRSVSVNSTVIKVSTGAIDNMKIVSVTNLNQTIETLKKNNYWIVATDMEGEDYTKIDYTGSIAIVIGNEGNGVSDLVLKNSDFIASIPMRGTTNSLNASVATGIVVFEALKCRSKNGL